LTVDSQVVTFCAKMKWSEVCADPSLQDLPYKVELNAQGQIVMSPHKPIHSGFQGAIQRQLFELKPDGYILPEVAVHTDDGTKTLDVAWISSETYESEIGKDAFERAPEICIAVISPSNTMVEMEQKKNLYLKRGAVEVWVCQADGRMLFFDATGQIEASKVCPEFPKHVSVRLRR
jgi:Uma2 family endonuclease